MEYLNSTGEPKKYRVSDSHETSGYLWKTVKNGMVVTDIDDSQAIALGLSRLGKPDELENVETVSSEEYVSKLLSVRGVGHKTADDIMILYPTFDDLKSGISSGDDLPLRDDVVIKLKKMRW